jgi:cysteinyl-tRNA synthetase
MFKLKLYNTETRNKEEIAPSFGDTILMYTCGPTVYNFAHIGNFRTYIFEDLLRRTLLFFGFKVKQVMNLTDVDDKTIKGALKAGVTLAEYTHPYIQAFFEDLRVLNIQPVEAYPAATDYIPEMIRLIEGLLQKGVAYVGQDSSVYFRISSFSSYGRLSHLPLCDLKAGASHRLSSDEYEKDQVSDFVLWKAYDPERDGHIFWESPFGKGRPGWHIECSAMAMRILGESIDIHVGGVDNMFPHHENEIAQSEAFSGKVFVKHWLHAEHLLVNHKKMSKSLGNFYTVRDLLKQGYGGREIRFALLQSHYRTQLNFTLEGLEAAGAAIQRILDFVERMQQIQRQNFKTEMEEPSSPLQERLGIENCFSSFSEALADDLNIAQALSVFFDFIRGVHSLADQGKIGAKEATQILAMVEHLDQVFGILSLQEEEKISPALLEALEKRNKARGEKNFALADEYRDWIGQRGYKIEDSPSGARLVKKGKGAAG